MVRRTFLKLASGASIAALVALNHFKFVPAASSAELFKHNSEEITETLSPVLQALRQWNEDRLQHVAAGGSELDYCTPPMRWDPARTEWGTMRTDWWEA